MKFFSISQKWFLKGSLLLSLSVFVSNFAIAQSGVGINTSGAAADPSAGLDVNFNDKGVLIPRVALSGTFDFVTIPSPAISLLVYNTTTGGGLTPGFYYFTGSQWAPLAGTGGGGGGGGSDWTTSGNYTWLTNTNGSVGIGTTSPNSSYDLTLQGGYGGGFLVRGSSTTSRFEGNVGIGFSTSSSYELDVDGAVRFQDYVAIGTTPSSTYDLRVSGSTYLDNLRIGTSSSPPTSGLRVSGTSELGTLNAGNTSTGTLTIGSISSTSPSTSLYYLMVGSSGGLVRRSSSASTVATSSRLFKTNFRDLTFDKEKFLSLKPYFYSYKEKFGGQESLGLVAEEVAVLVPELAHYGPKRILDENGEVMFDEEGMEMMDETQQQPDGVLYDRIGIYLIPIVAEHEATIKLQQEEIAFLKERLARQEWLVSKLLEASALNGNTNPAIDQSLKAETTPVNLKK